MTSNAKSRAYHAAAFSVVAWLAAWMVGAAPQEKSRSLVVRTQGSHPLGSVQIRIRDSLTETVRDVPLPGVASLTIPDRRVTLTCDRMDQWCLDVVSDPQHHTREILLEVHPAFQLHGRIVDAGNRSVDGVLGLEVQAIGNQTRVGGKLIGLQEGQFEVKLPMLRLDARLAVPGFAPSYIWALQPTGPRVNLGAIRLSSGSSVSGDWSGGTLLHPSTMLASLSCPRAKTLPGKTPRGAHRWQRL